MLTLLEPQQCVEFFFLMETKFKNVWNLNQLALCAQKAKTMNMQFEWNLKNAQNI